VFGGERNNCGTQPREPAAFRIFSIGGGLPLLVHALHRRNVVFIAGQAFAMFAYRRKPYFVMHNRKASAA